MTPPDEIVPVGDAYREDVEKGSLMNVTSHKLQPCTALWQG